MTNQMKFDMSLRYAIGRLISKFEKNVKWVIMSLWRHSSFQQTIVHISNSIAPTNFILGTNIQQYEVHLMIKVKVTLNMMLKVTVEGQRSHK